MQKHQDQAAIEKHRAICTSAQGGDIIRVSLQALSVGVTGVPTIGVNLAVFDSVLATVDINMPPLQGLGLSLKTLL